MSRRALEQHERRDIVAAGGAPCSGRRRDNQPLPAPPARRTPPRPKRWAGGGSDITVIDLQDEYRLWQDTLPANLEGSTLLSPL
jgi:hypothetical protein